MVVELPQVTLVIIDTKAHEQTSSAVSRTFTQIQPGWLLWYSNNQPLVKPGTASWRYIPSLLSIEDYNDLLWNFVPKEIKTSHALIMQYDGWVLNGSLWKNDWLQYDYIGAPWPWIREGSNVGNGGFSLRSVRLMKFLAENAEKFPVRTPEDAVLCREYRPALEQLGFVWAPLSAAREFSFEREGWRPTFGFHGMFNIPKVLSRGEWLEWKADANDYIRGKSEWQEVKDL